MSLLLYVAENTGRTTADALVLGERSPRRPVATWLGDGGMFYFREPGTAVVAGLDLKPLVKISGPAADLPPTHVGIHTGPVVSQDGDVYGRTVNLAARIASYAQAGQVVVSQETAQRSGDRQVWLEPLVFRGAGVALESSGLQARVAQPPAI